VLVPPPWARREPKGLLDKLCASFERVRNNYKVIESNRHGFVV